MGVVWKAEHRQLGTQVAVKLMTPELACTASGRHRFEQEARVAAKLRSPHVVHVQDHGIDEATGIPFIVMEMLVGQSLSQRLKRLRVLSPTEVCTMVTHIGRALSQAHAAKILHRDLKPDNVFLVQNGDELHTKVLDFGLAKSFDLAPLDSRALTVEGRVVGTPWYMSPEQIRGGANDHRNDLWSLAVIACECLTGVHPFLAYDIPQLTLLLWSPQRPVPSSLAQVPERFDAWFAKATHLDLDQRFQTVDEFVQALRRVLGASRLEPIPPPVHEQLEPPQLSSFPPSAHTQKPPLLSRQRLGLFAAILAGLIGGIGVASLYRSAPLAPAITATASALTPTPTLPPPAPAAAPPPIIAIPAPPLPSELPLGEARPSVPPSEPTPAPERRGGSPHAAPRKKARHPVTKETSPPPPTDERPTPNEDF
jgi:serine/threonine-protein kinase